MGKWSPCWTILLSFFLAIFTKGKYLRPTYLIKGIFPCQLDQGYASRIENCPAGEMINTDEKFWIGQAEITLTEQNCRTIMILENKRLLIHRCGRKIVTYTVGGYYLFWKICAILWFVSSDQESPTLRTFFFCSVLPFITKCSNALPNTQVF